ncbi:hypothetical protein FPV67DRAFT_266606 [Lyophyllum atratum]|nr:hypothetical protein FPV67DRAFT_266606 [Lyophyllum atratum]
MAPGNGKNRKGSKTKKAMVTATSPEPQPPAPTTQHAPVVPANRTANPADTFIAAARNFSNANCPPLTPDGFIALNELWNLALEIGRRAGTEEVVNTGEKEAWNSGYEAGRQWGKDEMEERLQERWYDGYRNGEQAGQGEERDEWIIAGHSLTQAKCTYLGTTSDAGIQTKSTPPANTFEMAIQIPSAPVTTCDAGIQANSTPPANTFEIAIHTSAPPVTAPTIALVNTETPVETTAPVNWADDADTELPVPLAPTPALTPRPRDFSVLFTGSAGPFNTIRHRIRRLHRGQRVPQRQQFIPRINYSQQPIVTYRHPSGIAQGKPVFTIQSSPSLSTPPPAPVTTLQVELDWDRDPRLSNLRNVLHSLGWIRA